MVTVLNLVHFNRRHIYQNAVAPYDPEYIPSESRFNKSEYIGWRRKAGCFFTHFRTGLTGT